ncbi:MAG: Amidohydrolase family protein, partial [Synergistales bacterium 53_16]
AACRDAGMFLMLHTAEQVGHDYPGKGTAGPKEAAAFCLNHPGLAVVFAHMGGGLWQYEMMPEMKICLQNAWYDTAAVPFLFDAAIFRAVFAAGVGQKILYGSDFPLLRIKRFKRMLGEASLSPEEESALFGGNAKEVESRALLFSD